MGSNPASDALIVWNLRTDQTVRKTREDPQPEGRWALILNSVLHPHPGRTLDRIYTSWGRALEAQANHIAYSLGLGPLAMTQKIKCYFGEGEQRALQLEQLRKAGAPKLGKQCSKLMGYSLPCVSSACCDVCI